MPPPSPPQQQKLIETIVIPAAAPPIGHILGTEIVGYITAYPLSEQTRGYIRKQARIILPPEVQVELNNAIDILQWVRFQWCVANGIGPGSPVVDTFKCKGECDHVTNKCAHLQPTGLHYICSRERGHPGDHVGCHGGTGASQHNNQRWPQSVPTAPPDVFVGIPMVDVAPPPVETGDEIRLCVRYYLNVTGTFTRQDEYECYVSVPRDIIEEGMGGLREFVREEIMEGNHMDEECMANGDENLSRDDSEFDSLSSSSESLREQVREAGLEID